MRKYFGILAAIAFIACGGGTDETRQQETRNTKPSEARGSVNGRIVDAYHRPLAGAQVIVSLPGGSRSQTVGEDGHFSIGGLPLGSYLDFRAEAEGHSRGNWTWYIEAEAGEFPLAGATLDVGDIMLLPLTGVFHFDVYSKHGEKVQIEDVTCTYYPAWVLDSGNLSPDVGGSGQIVAETGEGFGRCENLPSIEVLAALGGDLRVDVPAQDLDGDGVVEYRGISAVFSASELLEGGPGPLVLEEMFGLAEVLWSNLSDLSHGDLLPALPIGDTIEIEFSYPMIPVVVAMWDAEGNLIDVEVEVDGTMVRIQPEEELPAGAHFDLALRLHPAGHPLEILEIDTEFVTASSGVMSAVAEFEDLDDDGEVALNELVTVRFSEGFFSSLGANAVLFSINADLDESGEIGDAPYEHGNPTEGTVMLSGSPMRTQGTFNAPVVIPGDAELILFLGEGFFLNANGNKVENLSVPLAVSQ